MKVLILCLVLIHQMIINPRVCIICRCFSMKRHNVQHVSVLLWNASSAYTRLRQVTSIHSRIPQRPDTVPGSTDHPTTIIRLLYVADTTKTHRTTTCIHKDFRSSQIYKLFVAKQLFAVGSTKPFIAWKSFNFTHSDKPQVRDIFSKCGFMNVKEMLIRLKSQSGKQKAQLAKL